MSIKIFLVILFVNSILFAQDLDEKKDLLQDLNEKIKQEENLIEKSEKQKKKSKQAINSTRKEIRAIEKKIQRFERSEKSTKAQLNTIINNYEATSSNLEKLNYLCGKEIAQLSVSYYHSLLFPSEKVEGRYIARLIKRTAEEIMIMEDKLGTLKSKKNRTNKKYEDVIWARIVAKKKNRKYSNQITSLERDLNESEEKQQSAIERKNQLIAEAKALDDLIKKLQSDILTQHFTYKFSTPKLIWPLKGSIIKNYGEQKSDKYKVSTNNNGIDISAIEGQNVVSVDDGVVAYASWYNGAGKLVIIDHKNGFHSLYSHNSKLLVTKGDDVNRNQAIALTGKTGSAESPCLHFELRKRGNPVDPLQYLE